MKLVSMISLTTLHEIGLSSQILRHCSSPPPQQKRNNIWRRRIREFLR